jgi:hypothetical protein
MAHCARRSRETAAYGGWQSTVMPPSSVHVQIGPLYPASARHAQLAGMHPCGRDWHWVGLNRSIRQNCVASLQLEHITPESPDPASGVKHEVPLHPGASTPPHVHRPPVHVAIPEGSCPQHCPRSLPKQFGAVPMHPVDAPSDPASIGARQLMPLHPGAPADMHIHWPPTHVAEPAGS